jgi:glyoxylase-like metal-dependent hydrolase (beta-lactamase superfamily II)
VHPLSLPDGQTRDITLTRSLGAQLAEIGYPPSKIRYIALSHYHYDHTANANAFAHSTWLVRRVERDAMFAATPPGTTRPDTYAQLKTAKTMLIESDQFDVFGDSSVVIKFAPGHTPGHQVLLVRLKNTGPVLLSGDMYHFPQERTLNRFPVFEFDKDQTRRTRVEIDDFLKTTGASLWIQHDFVANRGLRKSPAFYDWAEGAGREQPGAATEVSHGTGVKRSFEDSGRLIVVEMESNKPAILLKRMWLYEHPWPFIARPADVVELREAVLLQGE